MHTANLGLFPSLCTGYLTFLYRRLVSNTQERVYSQLPPKKRKRRPSEDAVADVLQHMASFSQPPPVLLSVSSDSSPNTSSASLPAMFNTTTAGPPTLSPVLRPEPTSSLSSLLHFNPATARYNPIVPTMQIAATGTQSGASLSTGGEVRVCALQPALRPPSESPWDALLRVKRQMEAIAETEAVDMFVLPELSPIGYSEDTFARFLPINAANQAMYQEFDRILQITARNLQAFICYGTIGWSTPCNLEGQQGPAADSRIPRMFIRQVVVDRLGAQVVCYDKSYLCDYGVCAETRFFQPGPASRPTSFQVTTRDVSSSFSFGLVICADMRYPGLVRKLTADSQHRVDCILQPAAFARDSSFRTWSSFRETRAVENSIFWIGVNYSGSDFGESSIVPPWVDEEHEPITLGREEGYLIGRVTRLTLDHARNTLPFYRNLVLEESVKIR
jgi:predicted amidohydrolase